ncbi:MAG TPA: hypothetical protein VK012_04405, partial [Gemmatimonadales bacterium]|nr:hypothetical protein [Gemmatimonadales bacterium]
MRGWAVLPILALAVACSHDTPFESADPGGDMPFSNAAPVRLTYNDGDDRTVSWMPDGAAIIYSSEQVSDDDADRCLHVLPAGGGQVDRQVCARYPAEADTTDRFESPAVNASGRLAYLRAVGWIGQQKNPRLHLMLGQLDDPLAAVEVTGIPYLAPSGITHNFVSHIQWLGPDR